MGGGTGGVLPTSQNTMTAATDGNLTIVLGPSSTSTLMVSTDGGVTFNVVNHNLTGGNCSDVAWVPWLSMFVAVTSSTNSINISTSSNGLSWTAAATVPLSSINGSNALLGVGSNQLCVVAGTNASTSGCIITSTNGTNWTVQNPPALVIGYAIRPVYGANGWVIGSANLASLFLTSVNGTVWVLRTGPAICNAIYYFAGQYVLYSNGLYVSSDGVNWTARGTISAPGSGLASLISGYFFSDGQRLITMVGVPGGSQFADLILITTDLTNWQHQSTNLSGAVYAGAKCVNGLALFGAPASATTILQNWPNTSYVGSSASLAVTGMIGCNGVIYLRVR